MRAQHRRQSAALAALVEATRRPLAPPDRQRVMNQITMDAHARDVVEALAATPEGRGLVAGGGGGGGSGASSSASSAAAPGAAAASCFAWACQLRGYWDPALADARVRVCDASFDYGHEYLGNGPRLVITPLTDRVYVTATQAAWLCLGTAPAGPAGTGKTETTKDLAAALGKAIYVFNCSPEMDYRAMGDIFKGLAASGSWGCFDEFNRLVPEVLSVCSVQYKSVIDAQRRKVRGGGAGSVSLFWRRVGAEGSSSSCRVVRQSARAALFLISLTKKPHFFLTPHDHAHHTTHTPNKNKKGGPAGPRARARRPRDGAPRAGAPGVAVLVRGGRRRDDAARGGVRGLHHHEPGLHRARG